MSVIGSNILAGASGQGGGYNLTKSLRFRSSASAYLNRTPAGSPTSTQKFTQSYWVKRGTLSTTQYIYNCEPSDWVRAYIFSDNILYFDIRVSGTNYSVGTTQVFRDPSAWYHIVVSVDTTQATAANRVVIYINGVQAPTNTPTIPQNSATVANSANPNFIGAYKTPNQYFDGYLAEVNFVDGQALTPSSFGETSTSTGVWIPKKYTGTYGTNGFYLPFTDTTSTSTLGTDFSGNSNTWTVNNISLTSGSTYDSMTDVPTLTSATTANYCVLSPVDTYDNPPTEGNLRRTGVGHTGSPWSTCRATLGVSSGKWYFEGTFTGSTGSVGNNMIGVMTTTTSTLSDAYGGSTTRSYQANGGLQGDNSTGTVSSATSGDVIMIAFDVDAGKLWVGKNGTWMNSGVPASGTGNVFTTLPTSPIVPQVSMYGNTGDNYGWFTNFGQQPFAYTPPTGFVALNTYNLPTPTIGATASTTANKYFNAVTRNGYGSSGGTLDVGFQPDFVWEKTRNAASSHTLWDAVRGLPNALRSNETTAELSQNWLTGFVSNGLTFGTNDYGTGITLVEWCWKANGSGSTNTAGSITSTVSANTTAGFSIVTYTGTGANATVGHGLGVAPSMIIVKNRADGTTLWSVYHASVGAGSVAHLNSTAAFSASGDWNSTTPTSSVYSVNNSSRTNASGQGMVAYCFAPVAGYSAFGSYTGNGSSDGPFIFTGFRPRFVMFKRTDSTGGWMISDTVRSTFNVIDDALEAQSSSAEFTNDSFYRFDALSNGFKLRGTSSAINTNGGTYIYMAFAEVPQKFALGR